MYSISRCGEPTRGEPTAWWLGEGQRRLTVPAWYEFILIASNFENFCEYGEEQLRFLER
jgi:hypothetical protein